MRNIMKIIIFGLIVFAIIFSLAVVFDFLQTSEQSNFNESSQANSNVDLSSANKEKVEEANLEKEVEIEKELSENAQKNQVEFHSVSIEGYTQRNYAGSDFSVGDVLARTDAYTRYFITYESAGLTISGIMNVPHGDGPFPVLILNHGYIDPEIYTNGRGLKREQDYLARRGYVGVHPDYRNHAFSDKDPDQEMTLRLGYMEDVIGAVLALRNSDLPYIDAQRVGMLGHSMGGGVSLNISVIRPDLVDAVVLFAPVSGDAVKNFNRWTREREETAEQIIKAYGSPEENPEFWRNASALYYLDRVEDPIMIHHGTSDSDVPLEWSDELADYLNEAQKDYTYHIYDGEPHEFINAWPLVMSRTVEFFDSHLK